MEDLKQKIENFVQEKRGKELVTGFDHFQRVYQLAKELSDDYDDQILHAACFLHDIAPTEPHEKKSAKKAAEFLSSIDFPEDKIEEVKKAITTHGMGEKPLNKEAILLHDAEILDSMGAIGIGRIFARVEEWHGSETLEEALETLKYYRNYGEKNMVLEKSRSFAIEKLRTTDLFIFQLKRELGLK